MPIDLVLLRHGQSVWNHENLFTGWHDVPLTDQGRAEAAEAGRLLAAEGMVFDVLHTSLLTRAIDTAHLALGEMGLAWIEEKKHWRLNERHYGSLQGLDKAETTRLHGPDQVKIWRRAYDVAPPPVALDDDRHPANDRRYAWLPTEALPATECLADVVDRMMPYWYDAIVPDLRDGKRVLIAAHGNSLRALVKYLDGVSDEAIVDLNIPTGVPLVYQLDEDLRPVSSRYLGDPAAIAAAAAAVANQASAH